MQVNEVKYDGSALLLVLIFHQRLDIGTCACGWGRRPEHLGSSHAEHVIDVYETEMRLRSDAE